MALRKCTPCDCDGICPYDAQYSGDCEYWCGSEEPQDDPDLWEDDEELEVGFDPYLGCYTDDC